MPTSDKILYYLFNRQNPRVERADGYYYYDAEGNRYLDATSGAYNCVLGHTMPGLVADVLRARTHAFSFASMAYFQNGAANRLADRLLALMPDFAATGFYQSGADAVEAALRAALQVARTRHSPSRTKIIGRRGAYHGLTMGALALGGSGSVRAQDVPSFVQLEQQDCFKCPFDLAYPSCDLMCASALERLIEAEGPDTIAAFVGVPTTNGGPLPDEYWPRIREICTRYGILLVSDEVLEGMWRIGPAVALNRWNVVPDIVATGKALGAGFIPIFATLVTADVRDSLAESGRFWGGHTYSGHVLSCEIALAVLDEIESRLLPAGAIASIESQLAEVLASICERCPGAKMSVIGAMGRLIVPCTSPEGGGDQFYLAVQRTALSCGLLLWIEDIQQDHIEFGLGPPYTADREFFSELARRLGVFLTALDQLTGPSVEAGATA